MFMVLGFSTCRRLIKREVSAGKSHLGRQSLTENELAPTPRGLANRAEPTANPHILRTDLADAYSKSLKKSER